MGGDLGPRATVRGAASAALQDPRLELRLFGPRRQYAADDGPAKSAAEADSSDETRCRFTEKGQASPASFFDSLQG